MQILDIEKLQSSLQDFFQRSYWPAQCAYGVQVVLPHRFKSKKHRKKVKAETQGMGRRPSNMTELRLCHG